MSLSRTVRRAREIARSRVTLASAVMTLSVVLSLQSATNQLDRERMRRDYEDTLFTRDTMIATCQYRGESLRPGRYWVQLRAVDSAGNVSPRTARKYIDVKRASEDKREQHQETQPPSIDVLSIYPNPARESVTVVYRLEQESEMSVRVYDALGRLVRLVTASEARSRGTSQMIIDVSDLSSGIYFIRIDASRSSVTRKLTVVR